MKKLIITLAIFGPLLFGTVRFGLGYYKSNIYPKQAAERRVTQMINLMEKENSRDKLVSQQIASGLYQGGIAGGAVGHVVKKFWLDSGLKKARGWQVASCKLGMEPEWVLVTVRAKAGLVTLRVKEGERIELVKGL